MTNSFLRAVLDKVPSDHYGLSKICFILPSQRAGIELKKLIGEKEKSTIRLPIITTLNSWKEEISGLDQAVKAELYFYLYKAYSSTIGNSASGFEKFLSWADVLLSDFNDVDNQLLNGEQVFKDLRAYAEIEHFSFLEEKLTVRQENYRKFWMSLASIYQKFTESLLSNSMAHSGLMGRIASDKISGYLETNGFYYLIAGFNALSASEQKVLRTVINNNRGAVLFDTDPILIEKKHLKAGHFLRKFKRQSFGSFIENDQSLLSKSLDVKVIHCPSPLSQAQTIVAEILALSPEERNETVLILPDEDFLISLLSVFRKEDIEANITMGVSLQNSIFFAWIEKVLNTSLDSSLQLQGDPFLELLEAQKNFHDFKGKEILSQPVLNTQQLENLLTAVNDFLENLKSEDLAIKQALSGCRIALKGFNQIKILGGKELSFYKSIILKEIAQSSINIISDPDKKLQIMGLLESRSLGFKNVMVCSALEEFLPGNLQTDSFLPFEIRKHHGLPGRYLREAAFAYNFYRLTHDAETLTLIYYDNESSLSVGEKSRYINQFLFDLSSENENLKTELISKKVTLPEQVTPQSEVVKTPEILAQISRYLKKGVSASSINRYFDDPLEWYYGYVLRLEEPKRDILDVAGFGTLVHDCLDNLFKPYKGEMIDERAIQSIKADAQKVVEEVFKAELAESITQGEARISIEMAFKMISNYLEKEATQIKANGSKRFIEGEKTLVRETDYNLLDQQITVNFTGQADKIEEIDGTIYIVDYKTGKVELKDLVINEWNIDELRNKPKSLQLFMYQYLAKKYWPQKKSIGQIISLPIPSKQNLIAQVKSSESFDELAFEGVLRDVFSEMLNPEIPITKNADFKFAVFET